MVDWLKVRLNTQSDEGPLEDIPAWLQCADYPNEALISVGATRYTEFGETNFLKPGDRSIVVVYQEDKWILSEIESMLRQSKPLSGPGISALDQAVKIPKS